MNIHCLDLVTSHLVNITHFNLYRLGYFYESSSRRSYVLQQEFTTLESYLCMIPRDRLIIDYHLIRGVSSNSKSLLVNLMNYFLRSFNGLDYSNWLLIITSLVVCSTLHYSHIITLVINIYLLELISTRVDIIIYIAITLNLHLLGRLTLVRQLLLRDRNLILILNLVLILI